jgi:glycosyltransferase involved in cell wall biosynthesis
MIQEIITYTFFTAVGVQVVYLLMLLTGIFKKTKGSQELLPVSIVIAARNELDNLRILLPKLVNQQYDDFEIIVVDDKSEDDTMLLKDDPAFRKVKFIRIDNTPEHIQSKKYALTIGIKQAKNPVILLTDADCYPVSDQWVRIMASSYTGNKKIILGYSGYISKKSFLNYFIRFETLLTGLQYLGWAGIGIPYMGVGRNLSYLKSFFQANKGYKKFQSMIGGDDDLFVNENATAANTSFVIGREALVLSEPKETWKDFFRQKLRHLSIGRFYRKRHKLLLSLFSFTQILTWVTFLVLLITGGELYVAGLSFLIRWIVLAIVLAVVSRRFGHPYNVIGVPVLDFCYTFYYIFVGTAALFARKIRWS